MTIQALATMTILAGLASLMSMAIVAADAVYADGACHSPVARRRVHRAHTIITWTMTLPTLAAFLTGLMCLMHYAE